MVGAQTDVATLEVTELPIRRWTQDYKEFLEGLIKPEAKEEAPLLVDYKDFSADSVHFQLAMVPARLPEVLAAGAHAKLKLQTKVSIGAFRIVRDGIHTTAAALQMDSLQRTAKSLGFAYAPPR